MKIQLGAWGRSLVLAALLLVSSAMAQTQTPATTSAMPDPAAFKKATHINLTEAKISDLMGQGESCMDYSWTPRQQGVCCWGKCCLGHCCCPGPTGAPTKGSAYKIGYWEPSEVIEVSCRNGYSMLKPGLTGRGSPVPQSCEGFNKPGNSRWFFEARVWAIDGKTGGLRHQSQLGDVNAERLTQCSEYSDPGDTKKNNRSGYAAKKWDSFTRGSSSGPAASWEAYISDNDQSWALNESGTSSVPSQSACKAGSVDMANCWGTTNPSGWVTHPNPRVAAALVAWRAHLKAKQMGKVSSDLGKGYRMMMDYPFPTYSGPYGQSMGMPGGAKKGSKCFTPGDAGPEWYGGKDPLAVPDLLKQLNSTGNTASTVEVNGGVYIFTIWVKTSCIRWTVNPKVPGGLPDFLNGGTLCTYQDKS